MIFVGSALTELVIFSAKKNNEAAYCHTKNGMENIALSLYKASLDALSQAVEIDRMVPQQYFRSFFHAKVCQFEQPLMIQQQDILEVPDNFSHAVFSCIVLYNLSLLYQKMNRTCVSRQLLNLLSSLLDYSGEELLDILHPSFQVAVDFQKARHLEEAGCKDEALKLLLTVLSKISAPENASRFLLPHVMLQTSHALLKLDFIREGNSLLIDAYTILDRASFMVVQENGKEVLVDSAAAGAA